MSKYIATIRYEVGSVEITEKFAARAKSRQHVKEQYHRYTHENYGASVSRENEDDHNHPIGEGTFNHTLQRVRPVDEWELNGLNPIKKL